MLAVKHPVALIVLFTWIGFVASIAFLESWLKYRAPGVTLPVGLGIEKVLLHGLLKVEWLLALAVLIDLLAGKADAFPFILLAVVLLLLAVQTFWLLPAMDRRALLVFHGQGDIGPRSRGLYLAADAVKLSLLILLGIRQFQRSPRNAGDPALTNPNTRS